MTHASTLQLIGRAATLGRTRPAHLWRTARQFALFWFGSRLARLLPPPGVTLDTNVRVQRLSSLLAEQPGAQVTIGRDSILYEDTRLEAFGNGVISIGAGSILGGARVVCRERIALGARCLASWNVFFQDFDPHPISPRARARQVRAMTLRFQPSFAAPHGDNESSPTSLDSVWGFPSAPIVLGDDVWIGANVVVLKGARVGTGCIIAAGAVVPGGEYPPRSLIAGNPARVLRELPE